MPRLSTEEYRGEQAAASLEDHWLEEVEADPGALDWFLEILEWLRETGETELARSLFEVWDDELRSRELWTVRLEVLRRVAGAIWKPKQVQREVISSLESLWSAKPNAAATIEWAGLRRSIDVPARLWDRVTRVDSVLRFDVGEVVAMTGQGVGRVVEVNLALETLKIDFEKKSGVTLGFRAAAKMLQPLSSDHLLRRKLEDPDGLERLRDDEPTELLRAVLESAEKPLTAAEIREMLSGIVSERQWTAWWNLARRHPQVVTVGSGRHAYRWEASASGALELLRKMFDRATARQKIDLLRKNAARDPDLARHMASQLADLAANAVTGDPGLTWEIRAAIERAGLRTEGLAGVVDRLLGPEGDVRTLLAGIEDRTQREKALGLIRERRSDWREVLRERLLQENDPRVLTTIANALAEDDPPALDRLLDDLVAQPRRAPHAFVWLAERAIEEEALRERAPARLLSQILAATAAEEFSNLRSRLRPLVESGGTVPRLLALLDAEQASAALEQIQRANGLEEYQRESLATALCIRFPDLRKESTGLQPLYGTAAAIDAKREELRRLSEIEIPANRKAIAEARALGDLRENFEYKAARQRHEYLNSRVAALHRDLGRARPIEFDRLDTGEIRIGARIRLADQHGGERIFELLGPWDSRPEFGIISYESELGQKLLGLKPGDEVAVGENRYRISAIERAR